MAVRLSWLLLVSVTAGLLGLSACGSCNPCMDPCEPSSPCEAPKPCAPCSPCATTPAASPTGFEPVVVSRRVISRSDGSAVDSTVEVVEAIETAPVERGTVVPAPESSSTYGRPGFEVIEEDGRLWVFESESDAYAEFVEKGEPAKRVTRIGVGPDGKTVMAADGDVIDAYVAATRYALPGYFVRMDDGRLWVFEEGSEALASFLAKGEPAKRVTLVGQGPDGKTLLGDDDEVMRRYGAAVRYGRPGFEVFLEDGRLWVFASGSEGLADFLKSGEPAKSVTRVGAGPDGKTVKSDDHATLDAYLAAW